MNINDYKWLIPSSSITSISPTEEAGWNEIHKDYSTKIFSVTQDPKICEMLIHPSSQYPCFNIPDSSEIQVLIPGCGSEIYLQKTLMEFCPHIGKVYCTDFSKVAIDVAKEKWRQVDGDSRLSNHQLIFEKADSCRLIEEKPDWRDKFDYILVVNSVLSSEDKENRQMLKNFYNVLKPGGKLYGLFPTILSDLEIAYLSKNKAQLLTDGTINLPENAFYIKDSNTRQIYYTPLRLNRIFKEAGFKRLSFEINFGDSDILVTNMKETLDIDEPDIYTWEFLVRLEK
jgi:SAM-dependent methyltransferase